MKKLISFIKAMFNAFKLWKANKSNKLEDIVPVKGKQDGKKNI